MTKQYDNEKRLVLFPNDKGGNDKRPDFRGTLTLNGTEWKVSLWRKTGQKGEYWSGQVEVAQPKPGAAAPQRPSPAATSTAQTEDAPF